VGHRESGGRAEQAPRPQPASAKPADHASGAGNGQGTSEAPARPGAGPSRAANGQPAESEGVAGTGRPAGASEGARHAAGNPRSDATDDTAANVRIVPD